MLQKKDVIDNGPTVVDREPVEKQWYKRIDAKVRAIQDVKAAVMDVSNNDLAEVRNSFSEIGTAVQSQFSEEILDEYQGYEEILSEIQAVNTQLRRHRDTIFNIDNSPNLDNFDDDYGGNDPEGDRLIDELTSLEEERDSLAKNMDIAFLHKVHLFLEGLIEKKGEVLRTREALEKNDASLANYLPERLQGVARGNVEVQFSGYCINLILKNGSYKKLFGGKSVGKSFRGTIFNVINDDASNVEEIIAHEEKHMLINSFSENPFYAKDLIKKLKVKIGLINDAEKASEETVPLIKGYESATKIINGYISRQYDEIVADIDSLENGKLNTFLIDFRGASMAVRQLLEGDDVDENTKKILMERWREEEDKFVNYLTHLSVSIFVSQRTGNFDDLEALLVLFRPGETVQLEKNYLKKKIGPDIFTFYVALQPLLSPGGPIKNLQKNKGRSLVGVFRKVTFLPEEDGVEDAIEKSLMQEFDEFLGAKVFFDSERLSALNDVLGRVDIGELLTDDDNETIENNIEELDFSKDELVEATVAETLNFVTNIYAVMTKLNISMPEDVVDVVFTNYIEEAVRTDSFDDLMNLYDNWPEAGKVEARGWLREYSEDEYGLKAVYEEYYQSGEKGNGENFKNLKLWKKLKEVDIVD